MHRILAIVERDLRRFRRSPVLMLMTTLMPIIQLIVLGHAFGGIVKHLRLAVVDQDHGLQAVKLKEMFQAVRANAETFETIPYHDLSAAMSDLKNGRINGVLNIPPEFSRKTLEHANPTVALIEDNTDQFSSSALGVSLQQLLGNFGAVAVPNRVETHATLSIVEVYPYVPYVQFLLPGTIVLAIFVSAMIGGGIIMIDDKARGLHEGYLVTPINKFELIFGFIIAGVAKAFVSGAVLVTVGSLIAGIPDPLNLMRLARLLILVVATSLALISMMFLLMVRVTDPLTPRATFGMLNTVLFFPSGAVYPIEAFPNWMKVITKIDPFTYAVDGFKSLILKNTGLGAISMDLAFLLGFTVIAIGLSTLLFRRTL